MADVAMKDIRSIIAAGCAVVIFGSAACGSAKLRPAVFMEFKFPLVVQGTLGAIGPAIPPLVQGPNGLILLAAKTGYLQAFDPANADKKSSIWKFYAKASSIPPAVVDGKIIWASSDGRIFRLNEVDGKVVWTKTLAESVIGEMAVLGKQIILRESEKAVSAIDPEKGDIIWRTEECAIGDWTTDQTRILIRTTDNRLKVVNPDGKIFKDYPLDEKAVGLIGLDGKRVFTGFADGRFGCFDLNRGKKSWSIRLGAETITRPVSDGKQVYVVLSSQIIAALDARRGHILWWQPLAGRGAFPPRIIDEYIFVSSLSDKLQAFSRTNGKADLAYTASREIAAPVALFGSRLYILHNYTVENYVIIRSFNLAPPAAEVTVPAKQTPG